MYTAHSVSYGPKGPYHTLVSKHAHWSCLLYDLVNYWGRQPDPETVEIFDGREYYGTVQYGPLDIDGRDVFIAHNGSVERYRFDLNDAPEVEPISLIIPVY